MKVFLDKMQNSPENDQLSSIPNQHIKNSMGLDTVHTLRTSCGHVKTAISFL
jgi:hypothetical protein